MIPDNFSQMRDFAWWPNLKQLSLRVKHQRRNNNSVEEDVADDSVDEEVAEDSVEEEVAEALQVLERSGKLERFELFISEDSPVESLTSLLLNCKNIRSLSNLQNPDIPDLAIIIKAKKSKLEELDLRVQSLESELLPAIVECGGLKRLNLEIESPSSLRLKPLTALQSLTSLELSMNNPMETFYPLSTNCFPNLKELKISSTDGNGSFILNLVTACPNLTVLTVKSDSNDFSSDEMRKIMEKCKNAESLSFKLDSVNLEIMDVFLKEPAIVMPNILYLNFYFAWAITDWNHRQYKIFREYRTLLAVNSNSNIFISSYKSRFEEILLHFNPNLNLQFKKIEFSC